ncbi:hypothetical protein FD725_25990 [Nostoc sp. TCL26-01]|nr:hypothetical protein FD725_25990 [Nostoc sp. TCL26-01]
MVIGHWSLVNGQWSIVNGHWLTLILHLALAIRNRTPLATMGRTPTTQCLGYTNKRSPLAFPFA